MPLLYCMLAITAMGRMKMTDLHCVGYCRAGVFSLVYALSAGKFPNLPLKLKHSRSQGCKLPQSCCHNVDVIGKLQFTSLHWPSIGLQVEVVHRYNV